MGESNGHPTQNLYRYEDILRAVGRYIDEEGMQDITVLQSDGEMRVQGYRNISKTGGMKPTRVEHNFTAEEIKLIDEEAHKRRGRGSRLFG